MSNRTALAIAIAWLTGAVAGFAAEPQSGKATGQIVVGKQATALSVSYAVEEQGQLYVFLCNQPLSEKELAEGDALASAVQARGVAAVMIQLDASRKPIEAFYFHKDLPAGLSVRELTKYSPAKAVGERVAGRMVFKDRGFSWSFEATFDAPLLLQLENTAPLREGAPGTERARRELQNRRVAFTEDKFRSAAIDGDAALVKLFVDAGMSPDAGGALAAAIDVKSAAVVKVLADAGADVNAPGPYGQTPVFNAASMGSLETVQVLIASGANVNATNEYKIAPLSTAAEQGHLDIVKALIAAGADVNNREQYGGSAIQVAVLRGYRDVVRVLIEAGADVRKDKAELLGLTEDREIRKMIEAAAARPSR